MQKLIAFFTLLLFVKTSIAQSPDFKETQPLVIEGIQFIYTLGPEEVKTIDGSQYSFFNLDLTGINIENFSKILLLEKEKTVPYPGMDLTKKVYFGKILVINSIQLEMTQRLAVLSAEPNMQVLVYEKSFLGNKKRVRDGFNLEHGEELHARITVAVPKGQRPIVSLMPFISPCY